MGTNALEVEVAVCRLTSSRHSPLGQFTSNRMAVPGREQRTLKRNTITKASLEAIKLANEVHRQSPARGGFDAHTCALIV